MQDIRHRFFLIIDTHFNGNLKEFSTTTKIPYRTLVDIKERNNPSMSTLMQLFEYKQLNINFHWLLTGVGNMYLTPENDNSSTSTGVKIPIYSGTPRLNKHIDFLGHIESKNSDILFFYHFNGVSKISDISKNDIIGVEKVDDLSELNIRDIFIVKHKEEDNEIATLLKIDEKSDTLWSISPKSKSDTKISKTKIEYIYKVSKCVKSF